MKRTCLLPCFLLATGSLLAGSFAIIGCFHGFHPDDQAAVYSGLAKNTLDSVMVSQDRRSGVITLTGIVGWTDRKAMAESIARQAAPGYTIANRIQVVSSGLQALPNNSAVPTGTDKAIDDRYKATIEKHRSLKSLDIEYTANNGTLVLKGSVKTAEEKKEAEALAKKVPQVQHVVNDIQVRPGKPSPANS